MIAVIADDFTGAAELAGIGLRYGLKVELMTGRIGDTDADLLVVCTDSRSLDKEDAIKSTTRAVQEISLLKPEWWYKKIDSVFRGHVLGEIKAQLEQMGLHKAVILAANPSLGRTIREGIYYVNGRPVSETGFAADPEFAINNSFVLKMLGATGSEIQVLKYTDVIPPEGIVVAEAETATDIAAWANKVEDDMLLAGAGDFFEALLDQRLKVQPQQQPGLQMPLLYVCGTAFPRSHAFIREAKRKHDCVVYLPLAVLQGGTGEEWVKEVEELLQRKARAIVAIDPEEIRLKDIPASSLRKAMADAVKAIITTVPVAELFIEGGSTASAILAALDIHRFRPVNELERGVVRMKATNGNIYITVKPGSYTLPGQISALYH